MNIYLDIDGVLVGTQSPQADIVSLLNWILSNYPDNTYWLTTHCRHGSNRCEEYLMRNHLPAKITKAIGISIKPTDWDVLKTEAIDFAEDFVWLEDSPLQSELMVLKERGAIDKCFIMDKHNPMMARRALEHLEHARKRMMD